MEFDLEISEDGRAKAMNVTGPGGEPPEVSNTEGLSMLLVHLLGSLLKLDLISSVPYQAVV